MDTIFTLWDDDEFNFCPQGGTELLDKYSNQKCQQVALKTRILESCILPILLYSSQTWTLTKRQAVRLQITQRAMERSLLRINKINKIKNEVIRQRTQMKDVLYVAKKLKLKYAGYMVRSKNERWNKKVTGWFPLGYSSQKERQTSTELVPGN